MLLLCVSNPFASLVGAALPATWRTERLNKRLESSFNVTAAYFWFLNFTSAEQKEEEEGEKWQIWMRDCSSPFKFSPPQQVLAVLVALIDYVIVRRSTRHHPLHRMTIDHLMRAELSSSSSAAAKSLPNSRCQLLDLLFWRTAESDLLSA